MSWILLSGAVFCSWAMLRTFGGERERRAVERQRIEAAAEAPAPSAPRPKPAPAKRSPGKQAER